MMEHILRESRFPLVSIHLDLVGMGQFLIVQFQFRIYLPDIPNGFRQRMLHLDKTVSEASHAVHALALRQGLLKVAIGNELGLIGELFQRLHGLSHCLITD